MFELPFVLSESQVFGPQRAHDGDAGLDLSSSFSAVIGKGQIVPVNTGVTVAIPFGYCGLILPRSSMGKKGIIIPNSPGLIDSGYRGEIKVLLLNLSGENYIVNSGDKIAQLVIMQHERVVPNQKEELPTSEDGRGVGGFGSSGK
jgi:dUTP pyrophosphatase